MLIGIVPTGVKEHWTLKLDDFDVWSAAFCEGVVKRKTISLVAIARRTSPIEIAPVKLQMPIILIEGFRRRPGRFRPKSLYNTSRSTIRVYLAVAATMLENFT
ncbi:hypothetical protein A7D21_11525 [Pseudomonas sp. AP19]|nr:hypothetical protein A7D21_11525 [Pseudomonas sp. AP19]